MNLDIGTKATTSVWGQWTGGQIYFQPTRPVMLIEKQGTGLSRAVRGCGHGKS